MGSHKERNVSVGTLGAGRGASWVTLVRLSALSAIFAMALTLGLSAPAPVKAADAANFPGLQDSYWVIDNLSKYELQIWDSACNSGAGCYRTINSTALPANDSNENKWMDTDDTGSFRIRKEGGRIEIFTLDQGRQDWIDGAQSGASTYIRNPAGQTGYSYDMNPNNPDVIITYKNGAKDVNGNRSDVVINIEKFAIYEPENAKNTYASYRRSLLSVGTNGFTFRNYLLQPKDCPTGDVKWKRGMDNGGSGNLATEQQAQDGVAYGTGTSIDAGIKIVEGKADQSFLFSVGDLDVGVGQTAPGGAKKWGLGSEGIDLGYGFDLDTLVVASTTKLDTYGTEGEDGNEQYVKYFDHESGLTGAGENLGNYIIGTADDDQSDQSRFFVLGAANGASFTWTSKTNCDTDFLETTVAKQVWHEMPPVVMQVQASKEYLGADLTGGLFNFNLAIDDRDDNLFKNSPSEPTGGAGTLDPATGTITFPTLSFQMSDDETYNPIGTHYYKFYEVKGDDSSIVYDETVHTLKIVIEGADNDIGVRTLGYTLRAYLDEADNPFFVTHSSMEAPYGLAKIAAMGATSGEFLSHTFTDPATGHTYNYDEDKLEWVRDDGVEGDPPADATSTFGMSYAQARTMVLAGVEGFDNDLLESTVWAEGDKQYKYYDNVPLELTFEQASTVLTEEQLQGYTWTSGADSYAWGEHTGLIPWGALTQAERNRNDIASKTWTDPDTGDTYVRERLVTTIPYSDYTGRDKTELKWTDPATGDIYGYGQVCGRDKNGKVAVQRGTVYYENRGQGNDEVVYYTYGGEIFRFISLEQTKALRWTLGTGYRIPGKYSEITIRGDVEWDEERNQWVYKKFYYITDDSPRAEIIVDDLPDLSVGDAVDLDRFPQYNWSAQDVGDLTDWKKLFYEDGKWVVTTVAAPPDTGITCSGGNVSTVLTYALAKKFVEAGKVAASLDYRIWNDSTTGDTYGRYTVGGSYASTDAERARKYAWFENQGQGTDEVVYIYASSTGGYTAEKAVRELQPGQIASATWTGSTINYSYNVDTGKWSYLFAGSVHEEDVPVGAVYNTGKENTWYKIYYDGSAWVKQKVSAPPSTATTRAGSAPITLREGNSLGFTLYNYTYTDPTTGDTYRYGKKPFEEVTKTEWTGTSSQAQHYAWTVNRGEGTNEEIYIFAGSSGYTYGDAVRDELSDEALSTLAWKDPDVNEYYAYRLSLNPRQWQKLFTDSSYSTWEPTNSAPPSLSTLWATSSSIYKITWNGTKWTFSKTSLTSFDDLPDDAVATIRNDDNTYIVKTDCTTGEVEYLNDIDPALLDILQADPAREIWIKNVDQNNQEIIGNTLTSQLQNTIVADVGSYTSWIKNIYQDDAEAVWEPPANATSEDAAIITYYWVKNKGQADEENVEGPTANAVSDYTATKTGWVKNGSELVNLLPADTTADITLNKTWLKETRTPDGSTGSFIEVRAAPSSSSTASFPVRYGDASYTVQDGLVKENIRALPWTDPDTGNTYTWDSENNTWLENGTTPVSAPPDTATAQLWPTPEYTIANTGATGTFTNRKIYNLTIEKKIAGTWASPEDEFQFTVNVPDLKGKSVEVVMATEASGGAPASEQTVTADFNDAGEWSFALRGGQSVKIPGITGRTAYSVSEGTVATYTASAQVTAGDTSGTTNTVGTSFGADAGAVSDDSLEADTTVTFTNTKREYDLTVSKTVTGDTGSAGTFAFTVVVPDVAGKTLADSEGNPVAFDDSGVYGFTLADGQSLTIVGIPEGAQYMVEESAESAEGYTATVDGDEGRTVSSVLMADTTHEFVNAKFSPPAAGLLSGAVFNGWLWLLVCGILGGIVASRVNRLRRK